MSTPRLPSVVVMGVSGCGKSTVAAALAEAIGRSHVEGDDYHGAANKAKMAAGIPLDDVDRAGWLDMLASKIAQHPEGIVLTCSALKRSYRDRLRAADPRLRFVHLVLTRAEARERVASRGAHFFNPALVDNQFDTLEDPAGEPRVLQLNATHALPVLLRDARLWIGQEAA